MNQEAKSTDTPPPSSTDVGGEAITAGGLTALKAELGELETAGRREIARRILSARQHGDLKENAEYHAAKEDQAHLETRIKRLRQRLRSAVVVKSREDHDLFSFGRTAEVIDEASGESQTWMIVGPTEADLADGKISAESPMAKALLDRGPGEVVEVEAPRGTRRLRIERVL
jgi:transcription elongation factor GreA